MHKIRPRPVTYVLVELLGDIDLTIDDLEGQDILGQVSSEFSELGCTDTVATVDMQGGQTRLALLLICGLESPQKTRFHR